MWARVDDAWWSHPKVATLSNAAAGLWIKALSWSCHHRDDFIPIDCLFMFRGKQDEANELVAAGLWDAGTEGWHIHDWAEYQDKSLSEKRAEAGAKGGRVKARTVPTDKQTPSNDEATAQAGPIPSHPVPSLPVGKDLAQPSAELESDFDRFWSQYPRKAGKREAMKAYRAARKRATSVEINRGLERQKAGLLSKEAQFRPYPATWLNRDGWLDEVEVITVGRSDRSKRNDAARAEIVARFADAYGSSIDVKEVSQ